MWHIQFYPNIATNNDFFKKPKITNKTDQIWLKYRPLTIVKLVATFLEKLDIPHDSLYNEGF